MTNSSIASHYGLDLRCGKRASLFLDATPFLIKPVTAVEYFLPRRNTACRHGRSLYRWRFVSCAEQACPTDGGAVTRMPKKQFYGSIELDAIQAQIRAQSATGFEDRLQRPA